MPISHFLLGVLTAFIWGVNFISVKISYEIFTPFWLISARFLLSFFPLIFFVPRPQTPWRKLLSIALIMWFGQFVFAFCAIYRGVPTGLVSVLLQANVIFTLILARIFLKKTLSLQSFLALSVSTIGMGLIAVQMMTGANWLGYLFVFLSALCVAVGNLSLKTPQGENILSVIVWCSFLAFIPILATALYFEGLSTLITICQHMSLKICGAILFTSYFSTIAANFMWVFLMRHYEISKVAPFTLLVPVFALMGSVFYLHEPISLASLGASILVVAGLGLNYIKGYKKPKKV